MPNDRESRIRGRAHQIWESEGMPFGREAEHWERATHEIEIEEAVAMSSGGISGTPEGIGDEEVLSDVQSGGIDELGAAASASGSQVAPEDAAPEPTPSGAVSESKPGGPDTAHKAADTAQQVTGAAPPKRRGSSTASESNPGSPTPRRGRASGF